MPQFARQISDVRAEPEFADPALEAKRSGTPGLGLSLCGVEHCQMSARV
jgi:hypothetical protein